MANTEQDYEKRATSPTLSPKSRPCSRQALTRCAGESSEVLDQQLELL